MDGHSERIRYKCTAGPREEEEEMEDGKGKEGREEDVGKGTGDV